MKRKTIRRSGDRDLERLHKELLIHQAELEEQNRELREIQQRLEESRDRYADLYDFAPVGYVDLDERGSILNINLRGATMLGEARSRLHGLSFARFTDPKDRGKFLDHLRRCVASKGTGTADIVLRSKNGSSFPAQLHSIASDERDKDIAAIRTAITDLSERKLAEEVLRESEERFRSLVKDTPVGFFIVRKGRIAFMNPEQEKLFGSMPDSHRLDEIAVVHPEDRRKFLAVCGAEATAGSDDGPVEIRLFQPGQAESDPEVRWVHCRASTVSSTGEKAILVNMLDITRTRELERIGRVQEKMAALGHVAAGIAHEIRNPLSGINIFLASLEQILRDPERITDQDKVQAGECLRNLKNASAKIASVVQRVMAFSRPIPPLFEMVNLGEAVEDAVAISAVTLRSHGVRLTKKVPGDLPKCYADLHLIEQVVLNLITNADQAMTGMAGPKRMEISSFRDGDVIVIKVSDSGPGVPPHLREKIFDPYFTTKAGGTGIGLSLSHRIISSHGGRLSVVKSPLGGAEFRIRIPVRSPEADK